MIKRQLQNIFWLRSTTLKNFLFHLPKFAYSYLTNNAVNPINITIEPTMRCNLSCPDCFAEVKENEELTTKQWKIFLRKVKKHTHSFYIAGGEPFLRPDLLEILSVLKGQNFGFTTNGTLLNEERIKALVKLNPSYIVFSLDGTREIHDKIRGKGSYDKLVKNISLMVKHNNSTRVFINTTIRPENYKILKNIPSIAKGFGVDGMSLQHFIAHGKLPFNALYLKEGIMDWKTECKRLKLKHFIKPGLNWKEFSEWYSSGYIPKRCVFPWNAVRINPSGGVYFCYPFTKPFGNILEEPLFKILNNKKARGFRAMIKKGCQEGCNRCCKG